MWVIRGKEEGEVQLFDCEQNSKTSFCTASCFFRRAFITCVMPAGGVRVSYEMKTMLVFDNYTQISAQIHIENQKPRTIAQS